MSFIPRDIYAKLSNRQQKKMWDLENTYIIYITSEITISLTQFKDIHKLIPKAIRVDKINGRIKITRKS